MTVRGPTTSSDCISCPFAKDGQPQPYAVPGEGPEHPKWIAIGEGPGDNERRLKRPFCLVPETLVLCADLTWASLGEVRIGDRLLTIHDKTWKWKIAEVTAVHARDAEVWHLHTSLADVYGTGDHQFAVFNGGAGRRRKRWKRLDRLQTGSSRASHVVSVGPVWRRNDTYDAGWLAGFLDGEGHVSGSSGGRRQGRRSSIVGFSQNSGPTHDRACDLVRRFGYELRSREESRYKGTVCNRQHIRGGVLASLRIMGEIGPARLISNFQRTVDGVSASRMREARVLSRVRVGVRRVIDISTTAGSFIANGLLVHNCGASGSMLVRALKSCGVVREDIWITNAILCTPPSATDTDKERARACCAPRLAAELRAIPGKPVLTLGAVAARPVLDHGFSLSNVTGTHHETSNLDGTTRDVIPTIHPAHILRGGDGQGAHGADMLFWNLVYDVGKVNGLAEGRLKKFTRDVQIEVADAGRARELVASVLAEIRIVHRGTCDTETTSLRPVEAQLTAIALATPDRGVSVLWEILDDSTKELLRAAFADAGIAWTFHNRIYDRSVLAWRGMPVSGHSDDTLLLHHNAFPGMGHDLQTVVAQFLLVTPWKSEYRGSEHQTAEEHCTYNALDALGTARVEPILKAGVARTKTERSYEADLNAAAWAEHLMLTGMFIDRDVNNAMSIQFSEIVRSNERLLKERAEAPEVREAMLDRIAMEQAKTPRKGDPPDFILRYEIRLKELKEKGCSFCRGAGKTRTRWAFVSEERTVFGDVIAPGGWSAAPEKTKKAELCEVCGGTGKEARPFDFNPSSQNHVISLLKTSGVPLFLETKTGKTSTQKRILEGMRHLGQVNELLTFRENDKLLSTFVEKVARAIQPDGRIYPSWKIHMITSRWAAEDPQAQNWPKQNRRGRPNLRTQVVAEPGRKLVGFDFDKQEARIIAQLSGDKFLLDVFRRYDGGDKTADIHSMLSRLVWPNFDADPNKKELRDFMKRIEYGACYKGSVDTLWQNILKDDPKVRREDVAFVVDMLQRRLPGVMAWQDEKLRKVALPPHEMRSPIFGRRRCFPSGNIPLTEVANWDVQTMGAELMAMGLMALRSVGLPDGWRMIVQVHDACAFEGPEGSDEMARVIKACFAREITIGQVTMTYPVDVKEGRDWGSV